MATRRYQLNEGTILDDRYVIGGVLGEGGFGITYEGENRLTGAHVAIKASRGVGYYLAEVAE